MGTTKRILASYAAGFCLLAACSGGGGSDTPTPPPPPPPPPPPVIKLSEAEASRFLTQSTFGPRESDIDALVNSNYAAWIEAEFAKPPSLHLQFVLDQFINGEFRDPDGGTIEKLMLYPTASFWEAAIHGDDQLRQRVAFALSQILVVSHPRGSSLEEFPSAVAAYMDILTTGAFGNYRDLLGDVTYSAAMASYLTYLRNAKAFMDNGNVPDENYAREIMQLFTIGLVDLNPDGSAKLGSDNLPIETYDNLDVTELAKVFTGLSFANAHFFAYGDEVPNESIYAPLQMFPVFHSQAEKRFLNAIIPPNTDGNTSITLALDELMAHPNVAPFVSRQLIQRLTVSSPSPAYIGRVAAVFEAGRYAMPDGSLIGDGRKGDMKATIAAILLDGEARNEASLNNVQSGKIREPIIRFTHWARAFHVNSADALAQVFLIDSSSPSLLGQAPYRSPSVFNFYRPGYIAPGSETGAMGLTAPELQIVSATSIVGYTNFLTLYIIGAAPKYPDEAPDAFVPDYTAEIALADNPTALVAHLDKLLTGSTMLDGTKAKIIEAMATLPLSGTDDDEIKRARVAIAVLMVMTAPEFLVQR